MALLKHFIINQELIPQANSLSTDDVESMNLEVKEVIKNKKPYTRGHYNNMCVSDI